MPITRTPAFQTSDGQTWPTLALAQRAELMKLLKPADPSDDALEDLNRVLDGLFTHLDTVKDILRCTGRKPRKAKGNGVRKRKTAVEKGAVA